MEEKVQLVKTFGSKKNKKRNVKRGTKITCPKGDKIYVGQAERKKKSENLEMSQKFKISQSGKMGQIYSGSILHSCRKNQNDAVVYFG